MFFLSGRLTSHNHNCRHSVRRLQSPVNMITIVGENSYRITARGTDFLHAEDSYGTIFLPKSVTGNFVATVKVVELGKEVSDWFRFGIFVRNNLAKAGTEKGSPGSFQYSPPPSAMVRNGMSLAMAPCTTQEASTIPPIIHSRFGSGWSGMGTGFQGTTVSMVKTDFKQGIRKHRRDRAYAGYRPCRRFQRPEAVDGEV